MHGIILAMALVATGCGGSTADTSGEGSAAEVAFPPPSQTSAEICDMIGTADVIAIYQGVDALAEPTSNQPGCWFSVWNGETTSGEATVSLMNNGALAGYEDRVAFWSDIQTASPIADFSGTGYDGDATLFSNDGPSLRVVMHAGDNRVWEITTGVSGTPEIAERIARAVAAQS